MKIFAQLYELCLRLAGSPKAPFFLAADSFTESIFWPIPPDIMLIPMCLARPQRALHYAALTVTTSVLGAVIGYYLGFYIYDPYIADLIAFFNYEEAMNTVRSWYAGQYGMLMVFIGAFTPVPYKVIAIATGLMAAQSLESTGSVGMLTLLNFVLISIVGRGLRFFLEAIVIKLGGKRMEKVILDYIDYLGWLCVGACLIYLMYRLFL